jgi:hypothetical protein
MARWHHAVMPADGCDLALTDRRASIGTGARRTGWSSGDMIGAAVFLRSSERHFHDPQPTCLARTAGRATVPTDSNEDSPAEKP